MTLICTKTGRHWIVKPGKNPGKMARDLGLKDYEVEP